jgi:lipopolysaccharide transport system permease protein
MFFHIFSRGTIGGMISLTTNSSIMQSIKIRKEYFPIVATVASGILAFVSVGVFLGLIPIFQFIPSWTIILLPIPLVLTIFLILGLSYFLSIVNVFVRDIQNFWQVFVHFFLFFSPILWTIEEANGILLDIHAINPLGQLIEISHKLVTGNQVPPINDWLYATFLVVTIFIIGYATFHKFENKIMEEI